MAVVTGGAGGIGAAICGALAAAGAAVAVGYNGSREKAEAMLRELPGEGHMALCVPVTDSAALADAIAAIDKRHSRLYLLVNSAGITRFVPREDLDALDDALISSVLDVNVRGVIASVRAAAPLMRRGGAIVNISSIAAVTAMGSNIASAPPVEFSHLGTRPRGGESFVPAPFLQRAANNLPELSHNLAF